MKKMSGLIWNYNQTKLLREQHSKIPCVAIASLLGMSPNAMIQMLSVTKGALYVSMSSAKFP